MRIGGIIFFRMNSHRLPGKALYDLSTGTVLESIILRVKKIRQLDHFCIATSVEKTDDPIYQFSKKIGINIYRGSLNNVMERSINASDFFGYTDFLRICGDRPFLDPKLYDDLITNHKKNRNDLTTNIFPRTVPAGLSGEVVNVKSLKRILQKVKGNKDKEHLTNYFYTNNHDYSIQNVDQSNEALPLQYSLTLDSVQDLEKIIWIQDNLRGEDNFDTKKIMALNIKWIKKNI